MKKLFILIINFFVSLFARKKTETKVTQEEPEKKFFNTNHPRTPSHNNRKATKGRHVQVVDGRTIYHQ